MNSHELILLCEDDQQLTQDEVLSSFTSYFTKKLNTTGLDFTFRYRPYIFARTYLEKPGEFRNGIITTQDISSYLNRLSKVITKCSKHRSTELNVHYVGSNGVVWDKDSSIFQVRCSQISLRILELHVGVGFTFEHYLNTIELHPELATERALKSMYARVNDVVKAIRIVTFGE